MKTSNPGNTFTFNFLNLLKLDKWTLWGSQGELKSRIYREHCEREITAELNQSEF
jgi:hypothetical protein